MSLDVYVTFPNVYTPASLTRFFCTANHLLTLRLISLSQSQAQVFCPLSVDKSRGPGVFSYTHTQPHLLESSLTSVSRQRNLAASPNTQVSFQGFHSLFRSSHVWVTARAAPSTGPPITSKYTHLQIERSPSSLVVASTFLRLVPLGRSAPFFVSSPPPCWAPSCNVPAWPSSYSPTTTVPYLPQS